jgi:hypothetical protein
MVLERLEILVIGYLFARTNGALEHLGPLVKIARVEERMAKEPQGIQRTYAQAIRWQSHSEVSERLEWLT